MTQEYYGIITTIQDPTGCMRELAERWPGEEGSLLIVGDRKGPYEYALPKARLIDINEQVQMPYKLTSVLPEKHYARKNLGYLEAFSKGAACIYETDDDNEPMPNWQLRDLACESQRVDKPGWNNVYRYFTDQNIWPRGLHLRDINMEMPAPSNALTRAKCPIQQGLADGSPDVDAIWRLALDREFTFDKAPSIRLGKNVWCPFNSQSTWWWPEAYALMYLPSYCSFRMTDIWRSFIAQRCLWELEYELVFHAAEAYQLRNPHDPLQDFEDEVVGYLNNPAIIDTLGALNLQKGRESVLDNLNHCYEALVEIQVVPEEELALVQAWCEDVDRLLNL